LKKLPFYEIHFDFIIFFNKLKPLFLRKNFLKIIGGTNA